VILAFFVVVIALGAHEASKLNRILRLRALITVHLVSSITGYFFLSLFYSLLSVAFQIKLSIKYGHGGFMVFWMLNWVSMLLVGLALASFITILTTRYIRQSPTIFENVLFLGHQINIQPIHVHSGLALASFITILTTRYIRQSPTIFENDPFIHRSLLTIPHGL